MTADKLDSDSIPYYECRRRLLVARLIVAYEPADKPSLPWVVRLMQVDARSRSMVDYLNRWYHSTTTA